MAFNPEVGSSEMSKEEVTGWEILTELNQENPDEPRPVAFQPWEKSRGQKEFEATAKKYEEVGVKAYPHLNEAAKKNLGIRDSQDLGEVMHERASWAEQIEFEAKVMDEDIDIADNAMKALAGEDHDVRTGEPTEHPVLIYDSKEERPDQVARNLRMTCDVIPTHTTTLEAMVMLATDMDPEPVDDPNARTQEALAFQSQTKWLAEHRQNEEARKKIEDSPTYYHVKRLIEERKKKMQGEVDDDAPSLTDNRLFRHIDEYLTEREKADKGPENASA